MITIIFFWSGLHLTTSSVPNSSLCYLGHFENPGLIACIHSFIHSFIHETDLR